MTLNAALRDLKEAETRLYNALLSCFPATDIVRLTAECSLAMSRVLGLLGEEMIGNHAKHMVQLERIRECVRNLGPTK